LSSPKTVLVEDGSEELDRSGMASKYRSS